MCPMAQIFIAPYKSNLRLMDEPYASKTFCVKQVLVAEYDRFCKNCMNKMSLQVLSQIVAIPSFHFMMS